MRGKKQQTFAKEKQNNITTTNEREGERAKRGIEQRKIKIQTKHINHKH